MEKRKNTKEATFNKSILYVASECRPFCSTGGLADVMSSLPKALKQDYKDCDIRIVLPLYQRTNIDRNKLFFIGSIHVKLAWRSEYCGVFKYEMDNIIYYFIDNERYFKREGYYGYGDDAERFAFFSRSILEILPLIDFFPDIIHVNDWQSAMLPVYLKTYSWNDPKYYNIKTVLTIHNILYQGRYGKDIMGDVLGISSKDSGLILHQNDVNFIKAAMLCVDKVITVSDSYSKEIQTFEGGAGLDDIARSVSYKLKGIVNGTDDVVDNPMSDKFIWHNFDLNSLENKKKNKEELQKYFGLEVNPDVPVLSIVSRLVQAKGLDMVKDTLESIISTTNAQFVAVGEGEEKYESYFKYLSNKYPSKVKVSLGFSTEIGKKIYAGSDIYLMPSISEPCGISQMIASKYGAVPVVREVGGLKDTIKDFGCPEGGNGYTFGRVNSKDFEYSVRRAIKDYQDKEGWAKKVDTVMKVDFSWRRSMNNYVDVYKEI